MVGKTFLEQFLDDLPVLFEFIIMTLDLAMFKVNLLAIIHLFTALISPFILYFKLDMLSSCKIRHVSSPNSLGAELVELLMPFLCNFYVIDM